MSFNSEDDFLIERILFSPNVKWIFDKKWNVLNKRTFISEISGSMIKYKQRGLKRKLDYEFNVEMIEALWSIVQLTNSMLNHNQLSRIKTSR